MTSHLETAISTATPGAENPAPAEHTASMPVKSGKSQYTTKLINDLLYPFPVLGTIKMGEMVELENGHRQPRKNAFFNIVSQLKYRDHENGGFSTNWIPHPLEAELVKDEKLTCKTNGGEVRLKDIPVRIMFNDPGLTMRERYEAYDITKGRIACASCGNGKARTYDAEGIKEVTCPGPQDCEFGRKNRCKLRGRLSVAIEGQDDPLSGFLLRTSGYNSVRTLRSKLEQLYAMFGGKIAHFPMNLHIRGKLTPMGEMYYADLVLRQGQTLIQAFQDAKKMQDEESQSGVQRDAYEGVLAQLLGNGAFEDTDEDSMGLEDWESVEQGSAEAGLQGSAGASEVGTAAVGIGGTSVSSPASTDLPQGMKALNQYLKNGTGEASTDIQHEAVTA